MNPQVPVEVVIRKLTDQIAGQAVRIATLEALLEARSADNETAKQEQAIVPDEVTA